MIKSVHDYQIDDVFKKDAGFCYMIPKYQREYTWGQYQWKDLYDDICENDNGYFIGSIKGTQLNYEVLSEAVSAVRCSVPLGTNWKKRIDEDYESRK